MWPPSPNMTIIFPPVSSYHSLLILFLSSFLNQKIEKLEKTDINIDETLVETEKEEAIDNLPPEEIPDEFQCCVCLELLYKPVVLVCGHTSCFWCIYKALNHVQESNCPICRCPYNHFPSVCQLLHFLLLKLYPIAHKRRRRQVQEEEKRAGYYSLQFDQSLVEPKLCENRDILGKNHALSHLQTDLHSESCSKDCESSSSRYSQKTTMRDENGIAIKPTSSKNPEVAANASNQRKSWLRNEFEHKDQKVVSIADLLCAVCKRLLFRPVVLNCGHVYCESCFGSPENDMRGCEVCRSLQEDGFPNVCLILDHFLEEQFPEQYSERQGTLLKEQYCLIQAERDEDRAKSISFDVYSSWLHGNGPRIHIGVGCDFCGVTPIIGQRYKCKDCVEKIGFDLCEACYFVPADTPGRFNQQHKSEHEFELVPPPDVNLDLILRPESEQSADDDDGSDSPDNMDDASHAPTSSTGVQPDQGDGSGEPEGFPDLILLVDTSLRQEFYSDDPSDDEI